LAILSLSVAFEDLLALPGEDRNAGRFSDFEAGKLFLERASPRPGQSKRQVEGGFYYCMACIVFCAFALEAFLNHVGEEVGYFRSATRIRPAKKLELICNFLLVEHVLPGVLGGPLDEVRSNALRKRSLWLLLGVCDPSPDHLRRALPEIVEWGWPPTFGWEIRARMILFQKIPLTGTAV
jgi:hypothetical protein